MSKRSGSKRGHGESESEESSAFEEESSDEEDNQSSDEEEVVQKSRQPKSRAKRSKVTPKKRSKSPDVEDDSDDEDLNYKDWDKSPRSDGRKWDTLEHKGPVFAPPYKRLPKNVQFEYDGDVIRLSKKAEEAAGFYARFLGHEHLNKSRFRKNFFKDWQSVMKINERKKIKSLSRCNFEAMNRHFKKKAEKRKEMSKEEKLKIKEKKQGIADEFGYCFVDGRKEKIGNFYIEPPGLFRGRGDHPNMGKLKTRVQPEDVIINCGKNGKAPVPPPGHKWKEIQHDQTVSWLACWTENIQGQTKYVMLNQASELKGEKDWRKYEKARELAKHIDRIRKEYRKGWTSSDAKVQQCSLALYFIDKLALRAGNEKSEDTADTVGCCSLRFEHVKLYNSRRGRNRVVAFNFLGKDSIPYKNDVDVDEQAFEKLKRLLKYKEAGEKLFHNLNTAILNKHLSGLMNGLTAKVFRTYNASHTLQEQLKELTPPCKTEDERLLAYKRANREVAILCNHQRAVPKSFKKTMENLQNKIKLKRLKISEVGKQLKKLKSKRSNAYDKKNQSLKTLKAALAKLEINKTDKKEGKDIALGTSKLNYLDPRITVAWCEKWKIQKNRIYNKTELAKFKWAVNTDKNFKFD